MPGKTGSVSIRAFEIADSEDIATLWQQPNCQRNTLQMPMQSRDDILKKLENAPAGMTRLVALRDDRAVGMASVWQKSVPRQRHVGGVGMMVHDDYQGQGIGSALLAALTDLADGWLGIVRLELTVYTDNAPAIALYAKFGFETEGTHKCFALRDGEYVDAYAMARLRAG